MSEQPAAEPPIPLAALKEIERRCTQFERALRLGRSTPLKGLVEGLSQSARRKLLDELFAIECEVGGASARPGILARYQQEFPDFQPATVSQEAEATVIGGQSASDLEETYVLARTSPASAEPLPARIGEYEIIGELGRGGMGRVFEAKHRRLGRRVALKLLLNNDFATEADRLRFRAEAEAAARLDHPGIVPIYEIGEDGGRIYYSMAVVDGESLHARLQRGKLPPREAADVVRKVALAIEHAHARGVIHRDLKPANVLLPKVGTPRVTDFGLARRVDQQQSLTGTGQVLGTPGYMSPEQASGKSRLAGPASDVYGLGAILFACLKGEPPFKGKNLPEVLRQVVEVPPPKLKNYRTIDADLETIVHKCLEKDPRHRYATAADLAIDLQHWLKEEPIVARPPSLGRRLAMRYRRDQKGIWAAGALIVCVVVLLLVGVWFVTTRSVMQRDMESAIASRDNALSASKRSDEQATEQRAARIAADFARHHREGEALCARGELTHGLFHLARAWKLARESGNEYDRPKVETLLCTYLWRQPELMQWIGNDMQQLSAVMPGSGGQPFVLMQPALSGDDDTMAAIDRGEDKLYRFRVTTGEPLPQVVEFDEPLLDRAWMSNDGETIVTLQGLLPTVSGSGERIAPNDLRDGVLRLPSGVVHSTTSGVFAWNPGRGQFDELFAGLELVLAPETGDAGVRLSTAESPVVQAWNVATSTPNGESFTIPTSELKRGGWSLSIDPPRVLAVGINGRARLWDVSTGAAMGEEFGSRVAGAVISADGQQAVLLFDGGREVQLWDVRTRTPLGPEIANRFSIDQIGRTGSSRWAALSTHSEQPQYQLVDLYAGQPFAASRDPLQTLRLTASSERMGVLATVSDGSATDPQGLHEVRFWDIFSGTEVGATIRHPSMMKSVLMTDSGKLIVNDGNLWIWDVAAVKPRLQRLPWQLVMLDRQSRGAWVAVDQTGVSTPDTHPPMRFWPLAEGMPRGFVVQPRDLVVQPQTPRVPIFRQLSGERYQLWSVTEERPVAAAVTCPSQPMACAVHPDGERYLTLHDNEVRQWSAVTGEQVGSAIAIPDQMERTRLSIDRFESQPGYLGVQYAPRGQEIWVFLDFGRPDPGWVDHAGVMANSEWFGSGALTLFRQWWRFDAMSGEQIGEPQDFGERLWTFQIAPDNSILHTITGSNGLEAWDLSNGQRMVGPLFPDVRNDDQTIRHLGRWLSEDGQWLTVSTGREVRRYSTADGQPAGPPIHLPDEPINGYPCDFRAPAVSPDGRMLAASACVDQFETFVFGGAWNLENGDFRKLPIRDARQSNAYRFASDNRAFLSIEDQQLIVWDTATRARLGLTNDTPAFAHHRLGVFSPDGDWVITKDPLAVGDFQFWPVPSANIDSPETLERWLTQISGERMRPDGTLEFVLASDWRALRTNVPTPDGRTVGSDFEVTEAPE